jgi:hypothetical protein
MARQLGCGPGLPSVKQRPLLTTRPSITGDVLAPSTWHGTRFSTHSCVEQKRVKREAAKRGGKGVGKVSDANMGFGSRARAGKNRVAVSVSKL